MMASKAAALFSFILLIFLCNTASAHWSASGFDFIKNLQGLGKGEKAQGIQELKRYLERFGYLNYESKLPSDVFDDQLELAIKTYQINSNLAPTGILDPETVSEMMLPRCGVPDIINGKTRMKSGKMNISTLQLLDEVSLYKFLDGKPKWGKYDLTFKLEDTVLDVAILPLIMAFQSWGENSNFTLIMITEDDVASDLKVNFYRGDHGDGAPFDGPPPKGKILAHASRPPDGRLHFNLDFTWERDDADGDYDIETIALHEIGHLLGLDHSSDPEAVMYKSIHPGQRKSLQPDDIDGLRALYNH